MIICLSHQIAVQLYRFIIIVVSVAVANDVFFISRQLEHTKMLIVPCQREIKINRLHVKRLFERTNQCDMPMQCNSLRGYLPHSITLSF